MSHFSRRQFLVASGAVAMAGSAIEKTAFAQTDDASSLIQGKDRRMLVLKKFPAVLETPLELLTENQLTPKSLLFVRNNQQPEDSATLTPSPSKEWTVNLTGDLNRKLSVSLAQLREMEMTEYEMVLQCSGNGRSLFSKAAQTSGTQWGKGGVGNVRFAGVKLSTVLEQNGIEIGRNVRFVTASGDDQPLPDKEDFLHSLPVTEVVNNSILALDLNGEPMSAIHGGPIRLITPGIYATMNVKWLSELDFVSEESSNYNHVPRYRVPHSLIAPGEEYDFTLQNSKYNWSMKVKSIVLTPGDGAKLSAGSTMVKGVAFNDGLAGISSVYVSVDKGQSWKKAVLSHSDSRYGWTQFELPVELASGRQSIWCRAIDAFGRTQPKEGSIAWNPRGYEWNGIEKIDVDVT